MSSKPGWVAVRLSPNATQPIGFDVWYCGHKHLSFDAAAKCARTWRHSVGNRVVVAASR
jgi:hypothetical protein